MEILIALGIVTLVAVNAPVETKAPQEIKSAQTSVEVVQPVKPKAKPKKKAVKKVAKADPAKQQLLYYILGFLTLGATAAYFYFRKKSQTTDAKIYTSDELKQSLQQDTDKFKYQPPTPSAEPQSQSSSDPKTDDENKKS
ncbi:MAG: hypothetical protein EBZ90_04745 [Proteobacteria bacterium]|nr:hypothetical protein [Pseudomonadota bacterium]